MRKGLKRKLSDNATLPKGWEWSTLGEISDKPQYGWTTKANHETGNLKLLRTTDITSGAIDWSTVPYCTEKPDDIEKYLVKSGDILISRAGSVGVSFLINRPERAVFASYLIRFRIKEPIEAKYVNYYLKSPAYWDVIGQSKLGIAVPNVNATKLSQVPIPLAPLNTQQQITEEIEKQFSRLDEAVAGLKRIKANIKRYKAAVLTAAVEGKMTEEWRKQNPNIEPADKLLKRILAERKKKWEAEHPGKKFKEPTSPDLSNLTELAEGWAWVTFSQIALFQNGRSFPSKAYSSGGVKLLRPGNLYSDSSVRWRDYNTRRLPEAWADKYPDYLVGGGELIMNLTAQSLRDEFLGRTCITGEVERCLLNQRLARISPLLGVLPRFLLWVLKAKRFRDFVDTLNTGSLIQHMFTSDLDQFNFPLPPQAEQESIIKELESRFSVAEEIETVLDTNLKRAERLRQSILKMAFSGHLIPKRADHYAADLAELPMAAESTIPYGSSK
ncbi:MAG: restriction endonuclease subunit S [Dissulfurispiraceae bacterium]